MYFRKYPEVLNLVNTMLVGEKHCIKDKISAFEEIKTGESRLREYYTLSIRTRPRLLCVVTFPLNALCFIFRSSFRKVILLNSTELNSKRGQ